ncbi:hypothetical protein ACHAWF_008328 [Thalassiosira exigua]
MTLTAYPLPCHSRSSVTLIVSSSRSSSLDYVLEVTNILKVLTTL